MSDPVSDLKQELLAAAERQQGHAPARGSRRRWRGQPDRYRLLLTAATLAIATAVALLMIAGEFDLSVGSMVGFAGIMIGICVTIWGLPIWLSILIAIYVYTAVMSFVQPVPL